MKHARLDDTKLKYALSRRIATKQSSHSTELARGTDDQEVGHWGLPNLQPQETIMTKFVLALVLALATLAAVPASAGPYCQEDLGYGRTSSFGCGG